MKLFIAALGDVLLTPSSSFVFFSRVAAHLAGNLIHVLSPPLKAKSTMNLSLHFSLA